MKSLKKYLIKNGYSLKDSINVSCVYDELGLDGVIDCFNFEATGFVIRWANMAGETKNVIDGFFDDMDLAEEEANSYKKRAKNALKNVKRLIKDAKNEPQSKKRDKLLSYLKKIKKKTKKMLKNN